MSAASHEWGALLGYQPGSTVLINGRETRWPAACKRCLIRDDMPGADLPCQPIGEAKQQ